jgi:Zn-dependent protease with chaperone function
VAISNERWASAIALLILALAASVVFAAVVGLTIGGVVGSPYPSMGVAVGVFVVGSALLFTRPWYERFLLARESNATPATADEEAVLRPLLEDVCAKTALAHGSFRLFLVRGEGQLAATTRSRTILVHEDVLEEGVDTDVVRGLFAHEVGHHLLSRTRTTLLAEVLLRPYEFVDRLFFRPAVARPGDVVRTSLGAVVLLLLVANLTVLTPLWVWVVRAGLNWSNRKDELFADHVARELGYGPALARLLTVFAEAEETNPEPWPVVAGHLLLPRSHPRPDARVAALGA